MVGPPGGAATLIRDTEYHPLPTGHHGRHPPAPRARAAGLLCGGWHREDGTPPQVGCGVWTSTQPREWVLSAVPLRFVACCVGAQRSVVESALDTASLKSTGRAWWPCPMRVSSSCSQRQEKYVAVTCPVTPILPYLN